MKLIQNYAYRKVNRIANETHRDVQVPRLNMIKKAGVLWQSNQQLAYQYLHDHLTPAGIIVRNLCLNLNNTVQGVNSNVIIQKDLNWMGLPESAHTAIFTDTEFDILFSLITEPVLAADYITAASKAKFKVGFAKGKYNYFDLNINIGSNNDAMYLAEQQIFYLGELNK